MRIVLKQSGTGLYLKSLGKWTPNPKEALSFVDIVRAQDYSIYHRLHDTAIVTWTDAASESHGTKATEPAGMSAGSIG